PTSALFLRCHLGRQGQQSRQNRLESRNVWRWVYCVSLIGLQRLRGRKCDLSRSVTTPVLVVIRHYCVSKRNKGRARKDDVLFAVVTIQHLEDDLQTALYVIANPTAA